MGIPSGWELVVILLVAVLLFGSKKLPEMAEGLGKSLRIFKRETTKFHDTDTAPNDTPALPPQPTPDTPPADPKQHRMPPE